MLCPYCKEPNTQVIDSRTCEEGSAIRRRRKCPNCGARFTTYEKAALQMPLIIKKNGSVRESFTVRRVSFGVGIERTFPLHSPRIDHIDVVRHGKVRRAKLYYLRERTGKAAKLKEIR